METLGPWYQTGLLRMSGKRLRKAWVKAKTAGKRKAKSNRALNSLRNNLGKRPPVEALPQYKERAVPG